MRKLITICLLAIGLPLTANAAIYKFLDENGNTVFADQPGPNAVEIEKRDVQTIKTHKVRPTTTLTNPNKAQGNNGAAYSDFKITQPTSDSTVRDNQGDINVELQISPELNQKLGHKVVLLLDGKPVSKPESKTSFTLHGVDRGEHSISANIVGKAGNVISSTPTITIHLKRYSSLPDQDSQHNNGVKRAPMAPRAPMASPARQSP